MLTSCQVQGSVLGIVSGINRAASVKQGLYDAGLPKCSSVVQRRAAVLHTAPSGANLPCSGGQCYRQVIEGWHENADGMSGLLSSRQYYCRCRLSSTFVRDSTGSLEANRRFTISRRPQRAAMCRGLSSMDCSVTAANFAPNSTSRHIASTFEGP